MSIVYNSHRNHTNSIFYRTHTSIYFASLGSLGVADAGRTNKLNCIHLHAIRTRRQKSTSLTNKWMIIFTRNGKNVFLQLMSFFYGLFVINSFLSLFIVGISWDCTILSQKSIQILSHSLVDVYFLALQNFAEFPHKLQFGGPKLQLRRYLICLWLEE